MTIVIDSHIPFIAEAIRKAWPQVDICPMESEQIDAAAVREADVIVVRTRTRVDEALLRDSRVKMVCTATIGFDHIDTAYCEAHGIRWMSCPGCNAQAVCNYVEEALNEIFQLSTFNFQLSIGVVGVGHVGSLVAKMAERKGLRVLLNDPPKNIGISLDGIAQNCDIITFHVPLTSNPLTHTTYHLCDADFLRKCKPGAIIINTSRGGVVDEQALLASGHPYIVDVWENEPHINTAVLEHAMLASMHIAGYSVEGKRKASQMCLDAIAETFGLPRIQISNVKYQTSNASADVEAGWLRRITAQLKSDPKAFESLRKNYSLR